MARLRRVTFRAPLAIRTVARLILIAKTETPVQMIGAIFLRKVRCRVVAVFISKSRLVLPGIATTVFCATDWKRVTRRASARREQRQPVAPVMPRTWQNNARKNLRDVHRNLLSQVGDAFLMVNALAGAVIIVFRCVWSMPTAATVWPAMERNDA
jgi:hypothetical protein